MQASLGRMPMESLHLFRTVRMRIFSTLYLSWLLLGSYSRWVGNISKIPPM